MIGSSNAYTQKTRARKSKKYIFVFVPFIINLHINISCLYFDIISGGVMNIRLLILFIFYSLIFTQDYSIQFDGQDDYVDIPYSSSIGFSDTPITYSVWFKKDTPSTHSLQTNLITNYLL